jgi:hypothetical protein
MWREQEKNDAIIEKNPKAKRNTVFGRGRTAAQQAERAGPCQSGGLRAGGGSAFHLPPPFGELKMSRMISNIDCTFTLQFEEYAEAFRVRQRHRPTTSSGRGWIYLGVLLIGLYATPWLLDYAFDVHASSVPKLRSVLGILIPWLFVGWFVVATIRRWTSRGIKCNWDAAPTLRAEQHLLIDPIGLSLRLLHIENRYEWAAISRLLETENLFLFLTKSYSLVTLPKRALPAEIDRQQFRRMIARCIAPKDDEAYEGDAAAELFPPLTFEIKFEHFSVAYSVHRRGLQLGVALGVLPAVGVVVLLLSFIFPRAMSAIAFATGWFSLVLLGSAGVATSAIAWAVIAIPAWRRSSYLRGGQTLFTTARGLMFVSAQSRRAYAWDAIAGLTMTRRVLVVELRDGTFQMIPRRAFLTLDDDYNFQRAVNSRIVVLPPSQVVTGFPVEIGPIAVPPILSQGEKSAG